MQLRCSKPWASVNQLPFFLGLLAGVHTQAGSPTQALALLTEALAIVERTQERWFEAELHRLRAEALLAGSPRDVAEAEASLRRALAVAREQGAKFWELRAAITLARLWRDQGKRIRSRQATGAGLRLVHRRLRHARSERGQELARRVVVVSAPATKEISDWLEKLGMSEYAQRFAENDIDVSVLRHLTDQDLERAWRIARASAQDAGGDCESLPVPSTAPPQPALTEPKPQDTAERRQVTVMFSDLVGSTALSARMDPEDLREVISAYQKCVAETVHRFGGFVAKYMGDGVLVYFGYPQAHEDDAERAVRAGLELIAAVSELKITGYAANACRHRDRTGRRRRPDRFGCGSGASGRRRDAEPRSASAGHRRAEHGRHRREHAKTARQPVRT